MWPNASLSESKNLINHRDVAAANPAAVCDHCGLPIAPVSLITAEILGESKNFCCAGCREVSRIIHESGLENYYDMVKENSSLLAPPVEAPKYVEQYDLDDIQKEFVRGVSDNGKEAEFIVEGMHCASCVWLIEKALNKAPGVDLAEVNLSQQRLRLRWNQEKSSLSSLIKYLSSFGYTALPYNPETAEGNIRRFNRKLLYKMAFAGFGMMNMMWISISLYAGAVSGFDLTMKDFFHKTAWAIATAVLLFSGSGITSGAVRGLLKRHLTMDLPVAIGAWITWGYSTWQTFIGTGEVYFETVTTFLFIILVGRYLEAMAKLKASSAGFRLHELQPRTASLMTENGEELVVVKKLQTGDRVLIRSGDAIPVDGVVIEGVSTVNESMITGESRPIHRQTGDQVKAGTINQNGTLVVETISTGKNTVLSKIVRMVEAAQGSKAKIQNFADKVVPWFVAATISLAALTFLYWNQNNFDFALLAATSVLVITCPCALGMATPMSIVVGAGIGAKLGFLVRDGRALERLSEITHVVFDKTGTLTTGNISVLKMESSGSMTDETLLQYTASLEKYFQHPLAKAITEKYSGTFLKCDDAKNFPGLGVAGTINGKKIIIGNLRFMKENSVDVQENNFRAIAHNNKNIDILTSIFVAIGGILAGRYVIQDEIRKEAPELLNFLKNQGIGISIFTGDNEQSVSFLKNLPQLPSSADIKTGMLPEDKVNGISELHSMGKKVLMIGDGVNDAPALSLADVSIAMGSGADLSMQSSDVVLIGDDLSKVSQAIGLGQTTLKTIRQNITLSLIYNAVLVPVAVAGLVTPVFASIAMPISSLTVIANSIFIRHRMKKYTRDGYQWM
jgi:Cu2+-exporting ATPase